jgi:ABC-type amino acid transport substrate-binding protein
MIKYFLIFTIFYINIFAVDIVLSKEEKEYLKNKQVITMCVDPDWVPFEIINDEGKHEGIAADLINLVAKRLNIQITLIPTKSWDETLEYSKSKKCDILSFINETPLRKEWLVFTEPIFEDPNVLVGRSDYPTVEDLSKIKASIAFPKGTAMYEKFSKDFPNLVFIPVNSEEEAFNLVEDRKADLTLRSLIVTAYTIKKEGIFNLKIVGKPPKYTNYLRMGILKDENILRDILNKGVKTLTNEDTEEIVNNHVSIVIENVNYYSIGFYIFLVTVFITLITLLWNYMLRKKVNEEVAKNILQKEILFQQNKQAELGKLIGNISHQWRDSLSKIAYINLNIRTKLEFNQDIPKDYLYTNSKEMEQSIDFMSETMQNFLDYYKPSSNRITFDVLDSIKSALSIIDTKIKNNDVQIEFIKNESNKILGIKNQWMQIWINIINNSINEAIEKKVEKAKIKITIEKDLILIEDNCLGFKPCVLDKLNNKDFNGLGIKMCQDILLKDKWQMKITNTQTGALIKISK